MPTGTTPAAVVAAAPIEKVIEFLKVRCSWPMMKNLLADKNLKPGIGYPDLIGRAKAGDADAAVIGSLVRSTYLSIIGAGKRYVQIYMLDAAVIAPVIARLGVSTVAGSAFAKSYPLPLGPVDLKNAPEDRTLCEIRQLSDHDYQLVFCSKRVVEERTGFDQQSSPLVMAAVAPAGDFDRIVGFKLTPVQAFDVVTIRGRLNRLEIALDTVHSGLKIEGPVDVFQLLGSTVNHVPELQQVYEAQAPENVFPAIRGIYEARKTKDVNVTEIGIRTPSRLLKYLDRSSEWTVPVRQ